MKLLMPTFLLAFALAAGCSTADVDLGRLNGELASERDDRTAHKDRPTTCGAAGGSCRALVTAMPCPSWSADTYECEAHEGCCLDTARPDGGEPDAGEPDGGELDGGEPDGGKPDGPVACEAAGGFCQHLATTKPCGNWADLDIYHCGGRPDVGCCLE